jgi:hypothetical protein
MNRRLMLGLLLMVAALGAVAQTPERTRAPQGAKVYFISPQNGETIQGPVTVRMGLSAMGVAPAGIKVDNTGHHHLLIDVDALPPTDQPLPKDDQHLHFGMGQTETVLNLAPGKHRLRLILGDYLHTPHDPPVMCEEITITVR